MDQVIIKYGGVDVASGICPVPFFFFDDEMISYGPRWGQKMSISLEGQITGKCNDFDDLIFKQNALIDRFSRDFQSLTIEEGGVEIFRAPYAIIRNVSIPESNYVGILPFSVAIEAFDEQFFSGTYGVLDPVDSFDFSESDDGTLSISHEVSARGFNTSTQALENAKIWVRNRTGWQGQVMPNFISSCYGIRPCMESLKENINRFDATYSVNESYVVDLKSSGSGVLRYTVDVASGLEDGINTVSINGEIKNGCMAAALDVLRARYLSINHYSNAVGCYEGIFGVNDLNPIPLSSGVTENTKDKIIAFNLEFNNDNGPLVEVDTTTSIVTDPLTNLTTVSLSANLLSRRGTLLERWERVSGYFYNQFDPLAIANQDYLLCGGQFILSPIPNTERIQLNTFNGQIGAEYSWSDRMTPPSGLSSLTFSVSITPSLRKYTPRPSLYCNGTYYITDLGYKTREEVAINGSSIIARSVSMPSGVILTELAVDAIINEFAAGSWDGNRLALLENSVTTGNNNTISFSVRFSRENSALTI